MLAKVFPFSCINRNNCYNLALFKSRNTILFYESSNQFLFMFASCDIFFYLFFDTSTDLCQFNVGKKFFFLNSCTCSGRPRTPVFPALVVREAKKSEKKASVTSQSRKFAKIFRFLAKNTEKICGNS